jgi:hypothetical protein
MVSNATNPHLANGNTSSREQRPSISSVKVDVLRSNIWQNELNIANVEDADDLVMGVEDKKSPTRGETQKPMDTQSNTIRVLNLAGRLSTYNLITKEIFRESFSINSRLFGMLLSSCHKAGSIRKSTYVFALRRMLSGQS